MTDGQREEAFNNNLISEAKYNSLFNNTAEAMGTGFIIRDEIPAGAIRPVEDFI